MLDEALRRTLLTILGAGYRSVARPVIFRTQSAQDTHERVLTLLTRFDAQPRLLERLHDTVFRGHPVEVGGVQLPHPLILAAGFVKGHGFAGEEHALKAVQSGVNIIPGWRSMPALVGAVEFGSFTRHPRLGNAGTVMWRQSASRSTQNRVGLKNPGACAAAEFLSKREMPPIYGINIAVSPGVDDPEQEKREAVEAVEAFVSKGLRPSWFTLNVSCPNTEDDPSGNQTEEKTRGLCEAVGQAVADTPLWVKISPDLTDKQYAILMRVFAETGVKAVIATNTIGRPVPENPALTAGVGGGRLHDAAVRVAAVLMRERDTHDYPVDVIGCGGVMNKPTYDDFARLGVDVVQYWSGLIFRGPLMAAEIIAEMPVRMPEGLATPVLSD